MTTTTRVPKPFGDLAIGETFYRYQASSVQGTKTAELTGDHGSYLDTYFPDDVVWVEEPAEWVSDAEMESRQYIQPFSDTDSDVKPAR